MKNNQCVQKTIIIDKYTQRGMPSKFNIQFKVSGVILLTAVQFILFILIKNIETTTIITSNNLLTKE